MSAMHPDDERLIVFKALKQNGMSAADVHMVEMAPPDVAGARHRCLARIVVDLRPHGLGLLQRLRAPRPPMNRIVLVQQQIGAGFAVEPVLAHEESRSCGWMRAGAVRRAVSAGIFEGRDTTNMPRAELADLIKDLTAQMMGAARDLQFELAARIRDEIHDLKKELRGMDAAGLK